MDVKAFKRWFIQAEQLADTVRRAEQFADGEGAQQRSPYVGESELIEGLSLPVYEDPVPQEHPTQRAFRDGVLWALQYALDSADPLETARAMLSVCQEPVTPE